MRRLAISTLVFVLCSGLAYADQGERGAAVRIDRAAGLKAVADSKPLFYSLGSDVSFAGIRQVRFLVKVDGRPFLSETIDVSKGQAAGSSFELLAARPDLLDRLYTIAGSDPGKVSISIQGDGRELRSFSFRDFVTYNRDIKTSTRLRLQPRESKVEVLDPSATPVSTPRVPSVTKPGPRSSQEKGWQLNEGCMQWCDYQRQECINSGGCGYSDLCDPCEDAYWACVNQNCWTWVCEDPKSQTTTYEREPVNAYWRGSSCLEDYWGNLELYDSYEIVYKVYRVTRTEYCDGTSSTSSVYVYDTSEYCSEPTYFSCSHRNGFVSNIC